MTKQTLNWYTFCGMNSIPFWERLKAKSSIKHSLKYWNLMAYFINYAKRYITKTLTKNQWKAIFSPFPRKTISESLRITDVQHPLLKLVTHIKPSFSIISDLKLRKSLGKIGTVFGEIDPQFSDCDFLFNHWRNTCKKSWSKTLVCRFDSIHRGKREQTLLAYDFSKETVKAIMMLYNNTKAMIHSLIDTDYFDIVAGVLQGDIFAQISSIFCLDDVLWTSIDLMKEKCLSRKNIPETNDIPQKLLPMLTTQF